MNCLLFYTFYGLLLFLLFYKQRKCWYFIWQLNGWHGLIQQPVLWLLLLMYMEPKSIMSSIQRCNKYFQFPLAIIVFNRVLLYVDDPDTMESILTAPECLNKTILQNGFYANKGLLHAKDEHWKIRRKQLNPAFSHNTLVSFFEVYNRVSNELKLKIADNLLGHSCSVKFKSLEDLITRAVLEVSCLTTMGFKTNFLKTDEKCMAQTYRYLMELTALRILKPWYQIDFIFRFLDNKNYEKSIRANKLVNEFVENIVHQKHIEWQHKHTLMHEKLDITRTTTDCATTMKNETREVKTPTSPPLNKHVKQHNFTSNRDVAANDANEFSSLPDANVSMQQQRQRIFIDQLFHLAQTGKITLEDIINESQSMIVVSFETVSSCIINALLCLAINHECQIKLRHEIRQIQSSLLSKAEIKRKSKLTTPRTSIKHNKDKTATSATAINLNEACTNTIEVDDDFDMTTAETVVCEGDVNNCSGSRVYNASHDDIDVDIADDENDCDVKVTMEHLLNMPYLDMIINESLRLLTTVPMNLRNVSTDFQLNIAQRDKCFTASTATSISNNKHSCNKSNRRSVVVPKDTMIALDTFNMQRNEMYWGKNALKFHPEHFEKKHQQQQKGKHDEESETAQKIYEVPISPATTTTGDSSRHSYAFIPFSKGLRTCIGYRYSIYLTKIVLIKLISSFEFSTNIQLQDLQCYEGVSLKFRNTEKIQFQINPVG